MDQGFEEVPVVLAGFRGAVAAEYHNPFFLKALSEPGRLMESGRVIHRGRNRLAVVTIAGSSGLSHEAVPAVLKEFRFRGLTRLKSLVFPSKALKAWRGAAALVSRSVPTPRPVAYVERRKSGMAVEGYYLAEKVERVEEVRSLFRSLDGEGLNRLLRALAAFLRDCHSRGILHKDLSDGNILVREDGRGGYGFFLLDTNRVRLRKRIGMIRAAGNLVRLGVPPHVQKSFLSHYWAGRPVPRMFFLWYRFRKKAYAGILELKKKLRLRKLAQKLGVQ